MILLGRLRHSVRHRLGRTKHPDRHVGTCVPPRMTRGQTGHGRPCRAPSESRSAARAVHARDFGGHISSLIPNRSSLNVKREAWTSTGQRSASRLSKSKRQVGFAKRSTLRNLLDLDFPLPCGNALRRQPSRIKIREKRYDGRDTLFGGFARGSERRAYTIGEQGCSRPFLARFARLLTRPPPQACDPLIEQSDESKCQT